MQMRKQIILSILIILLGQIGSMAQTPTPTPIPEDINEDGVVDYKDLMRLQAEWHVSSEPTATHAPTETPTPTGGVVYTHPQPLDSWGVELVGTGFLIWFNDNDQAPTQTILVPVNSLGQAGTVKTISAPGMLKSAGDRAALVNVPSFTLPFQFRIRYVDGNGNTVVSDRDLFQTNTLGGFALAGDNQGIVFAYTQDPATTVYVYRIGLDGSVIGTTTLTTGTTDLMGTFLRVALRPTEIAVVWQNWTMGSGCDDDTHYSIIFRNSGVALWDYAKVLIPCEDATDEDTSALLGTDSGFMFFPDGVPFGCDNLHLFSSLGGIEGLRVSCPLTGQSHSVWTGQVVGGISSRACNRRLVEYNSNGVLERGPIDVVPSEELADVRGIEVVWNNEKYYVFYTLTSEDSQNIHLITVAGK